MFARLARKFIEACEGNRAPIQDRINDHSKGLPPMDTAETQEVNAAIACDISSGAQASICVMRPLELKRRAASFL